MSRQIRIAASLDWARGAIGFLGVALIALAAFALAPVQPAQAAYGENHGILRVGSDEFYNYDYGSKENSAENVDWALSLLFYNNSSVNKVKDGLQPWFGKSGSAAFLHYVSPTKWDWDEDKGKKEFLCTAIGDNVHYRIYGPKGSDRFGYNLSWGWYNVASTHIDHNECNVIGKWFGASEKAEGIVARAARRAFGRRHVRGDQLNFHNHEKTENEGSHHWENDGYATTVWVR